MAKWYYKKDGVECGPVSTQELKELARSGRISETDRVKKEGMEKWARAVKVQGLFQAVPQQPVGQTPPPVPPIKNEPAAANEKQPDLKAAAKTFFDAAVQTVTTKGSEAKAWAQENIEVRQEQIVSKPEPNAGQKTLAENLKKPAVLIPLLGCGLPIALMFSCVIISIPMAIIGSFLPKEADTDLSVSSNESTNKSRADRRRTGIQALEGRWKQVAFTDIGWKERAYEGVRIWIISTDNHSIAFGSHEGDEAIYENKYRTEFGPNGAFTIHWGKRASPFGRGQITEPDKGAWEIRDNRLIVNFDNNKRVRITNVDQRTPNAMGIFGCRWIFERDLE